MSTPFLFDGTSNLIVAGNVGIGTTNPTQKLDVNGAVQSTSFIGPIQAYANVKSTAITWNGTNYVEACTLSNIPVGTYLIMVNCPSINKMGGFFGSIYNSTSLTELYTWFLDPLSGAGNGVNGSAVSYQNVVTLSSTSTLVFRFKSNTAGTLAMNTTSGVQPIAFSAIRIS